MNLRLNFIKMHGAGNDFIVFEDFENKYKDLGTLAKKLCDRHFGIGGDGILVARESDISDIEMIIINADGSYASMCGNGIRCFAKFVYENGYVNNEKIKIQTGDGIKEAILTLEDDKVSEVTINMGIPSFNPIDYYGNSKEEIVNKLINISDKKYKITSMLMGVPHTVIIDKINNYDVEEGKLIEKFELFSKGTNVNFCEVKNRNHVIVKTWERGAGATLACGTGSCASVIACNKLNLVDNKVKVTIPGGELTVEITNDGIMMTGPAKVVFKGEI
ncbi:MAG: diaminopimelate epimerase [Clostridium argentinense]|nr:diaminopimelate epimerase [Clostridium argentinense]